MYTYPSGWLDLTREQHLDLGTMLYLTDLTSTHRQRTMAQSIYVFETTLRLGQYCPSAEFLGPKVA